MDLIGRHEAIGAVRHAIDHGRGAFVIVASAGGGVSAVLDAVAVEAEASPHAPAVIRAAGRHHEATVPLATVRELAAHDPSGSLRSVIEHCDNDTLSDALFQWSTRLDDPVVVIVDDLHMADRVSFEAIVHLARRVELTTAVITLGTHDAAELSGFRTIELHPLTIDELMALLTTRTYVSDPGVARKVATVASGSPLVAIEVARALDDAQRRGADPLPSFAVTTTPIRHAFAHPFAALPESARHALCVAAAEPSGEIRVIAPAIRDLGGSVDDLDPGEAAGLITISDGRAEFDHPIRRSAAYHQLAPASRRAAHRALAAALDAPRDAERRAAHLAAGVVEPNEDLAADLELVAEAAERRRDLLEARRWWLAAARLSPSSDSSHRRRSRADSTSAADPEPLAVLTRAERRVAAVVGTGESNKGAAAKLFVSVKTVDAHLQSIYRKLGIGSRAELAVLVTQADLADAAAAG